MTGDTIRDKAYKLADNVFRHEREVRVLVREREEGALKKTGGNGPGHSFISDPTAQEAVFNIDGIGKVTCSDGWYLYHPQVWLAIVGKAYSIMSEWEGSLLRHFYRGGSAIAAGMAYGCDRATVYRIRRKLLSVAVEIACQRGLVHVV